MENDISQCPNTSEESESRDSTPLHGYSYKLLHNRKFTPFVRSLVRGLFCPFLLCAGVNGGTSKAEEGAGCPLAEEGVLCTLSHVLFIFCRVSSGAPRRKDRVLLCGRLFRQGLFAFLYIDFGRTFAFSLYATPLRYLILDVKATGVGHQ